MKSPRLFRYSGSKSRLLKYYRRPPSGTKRIVEPYLGSGCYLLSSGLPGLGYETNGDVVAMWKWLQTTSPAELKDLYRAVEEIKIDPSTPVKPDVRLMLGLNLGQQTYVRINTTGVLVGQLTAWKIYPQNRLPIEQTIACLPLLKDIEVIHGSAALYKHQDGDALFVDPPYLGTTAGYVEKGGNKSHETTYKPLETIDLINSTSNPILVTYGDGAVSHFPGLQWQPVMTRKVPNIRRGGTVDRTEWAAYVNWTP
jgi:site-specific DNA-adenine methylase